MTRAPVAIVHDYLTQRGGAERVVLALHRTFPEAPIYTSLYDRDGTFPEFGALELHTSALNRVAAFRKNHRAALPFLAPVFSAMHVDADVVICSSSGWAHGARASGRKIVYCYAPARWLYQSDAYLAQSGAVTRGVLRALRPALVRWDRRAAKSADEYVAISNHSRGMIRDTYGIDAEVAFPPCTIDSDGSQSELPDLERSYVLCVSRLLPYKNVDSVVEAFGILGSDRLVVVGAGPDETRLKALASPNVEFRRSVTDDELRWLYANADALVAASFEDFGLTPVEAAAFGTPTIALRYGGYLDTVIEGSTGVFFNAPDADLIAHAVQELRATAFDEAKITEHARRFGVERFTDQMRALAESASRSEPSR